MATTIQEEAAVSTRTFDIVRWIRARRLQWVVHILRMDQERLVYKALYFEHTHRTNGGLLMDLDASYSWKCQQTGPPGENVSMPSATAGAHATSPAFQA